MLLYSFRHYSLPRQSSSVRPPLASPAELSQNDEDCRCYETAAHHKTDLIQKTYEIESQCGGYVIRKWISMQVIVLHASW